MRVFHSSQFRGPLLAAVAGLLCLFGLAACSDSTVTPTAAGSVTAEAPTTAGTASVAAIELTDEGFAPDRVEVTQGTRLTLRNGTESTLSVVIKGRGENPADITIEAGQTVDLNVHQLGAYVITLADDPRVTASIFIS